MKAILLDTCILGSVVHPGSKSPNVQACVKWAASLLGAGVPLFMPGIADYEVRRGLLVGSPAAIQRLDLAREQLLTFLPILQQDLDLASQIWAKKKLAHQPTAGDERIDADSILCAQAQRLEADRNVAVIVATTNIKHLVKFVDARPPEKITVADAT